jgi:hypothetical protein
VPQATSPASRARAQLVDDRARRIEDDLARDRADHRPDDKRRAAGPHDRALPNRNTRNVKPR